MEGHIILFKNVMHHPGNTIEKWFLELMGLYVSMLNQCQYCIAHHYAGMAHLINDEPRAQLLRSALDAGDWQKAFDPRQMAALQYVKALTTHPANINETSIHHLRDAGWSDGQLQRSTRWWPILPMPIVWCLVSAQIPMEKSMTMTNGAG